MSKKINLIILFQIIWNWIYSKEAKRIVLPIKDYFYGKSIGMRNFDFLTFFAMNYELKFYTDIKIGTPDKKLIININSETNEFRIKRKNEIFSEYSNDMYIPQNSLTFKNLSEENNNYNYSGYLMINENIKLYIDKEQKNTKEAKNFKINLEIQKSSSENKNEFLYGEMGFFIISKENELTSFISQLKKLKIIDSTNYFIEYSSEHEGFISIGGDPHEFDKDNYFFSEQLVSTYIKQDIASKRKINIEFQKIYFFEPSENVIMEIKQNNVFFNIERGVIIGPKNYFNLLNEVFFKKYKTLQICKEDYVSKSSKDFYIIACKKDENIFNIKSFPSLYFFSKDLNYTFVLDYEDLFQENNGIYYFLVIYCPSSKIEWEFGKPFLKKYMLTVNNEEKTISFYNKDIEININYPNTKFFIILKYVSLILLCVLFFFTLILGAFCLGKNFNIPRKKRANELDDDNYIYQKNKNSENNGTNYEYNLIND